MYRFFGKITPKYANAQSKDVHYLLTNNALLTRNRISKWDRNVSEFCKFCLNKGNTIKETNFHAFVECNRLKEFWDKFAKFFRTFGLPLSDRTKIFGPEISDKSVTSKILNACLQVAQNTIWLTRMEYELKNVENNEWKKFKTTIKHVLKIYEKYNENKRIISMIIEKMEII